MNHRLSALAFVAGIVLSGCAVQPEQKNAEAGQAAQERCVPTTGSNLCRRGGSTSPTAVISREEIERNPLPSTSGIDPGRAPSN